MRCIVHPVKELRGTVVLQGDKSLSHRAALFAGLAEGESRIQNFLLAGVTRPMLAGLSGVGIEWHLNGEELVVNGKGLGGWQAAKEAIYCGNSATTLRLFTGAMAATNTSGILDGSEALRRRPMDRIVKPLQEAGVNIQSTGGYAPLVMGRSKMPLKGMRHELSIASAQVKTCLILAGLSGDDASTIVEPGPSRDHSERMLSSMGANISSRVEESQQGKRYYTFINPLEKPLAPLDVRLPGDISSAAFFVVAGLIAPDAHIEIKGVGLNPTRTGLIDVLTKMNANLFREDLKEQGGEPAGDLVVETSVLNGTTVEGEDVVRMIDEFPIFGVASAYAKGETVVRQAEELRYKESDRIAMLCQELRRLGVEITELADGFRVHGGRRIQGGEVDAHGDHRLAMALMVAGLGAEDAIRVNGAEVVSESLPEFIPLLRELGVDVECQE